MKINCKRANWPYRVAALAALALNLSSFSTAQASPAAGKSTAAPSPHALEHAFLDAVRDGNAQKVLAYIPDGGVNVGREAQHLTHAEVEQQFQSHRGLYCKLFDSSCIAATIDLANSARTCSYRELLSTSQKLRTAASEVTRSGVQQAVLVAEVKNDQCPGQNLIDFIFNLQADGWKLFSIP
jgi:hypothetical protein